MIGVSLYYNLRRGSLVRWSDADRSLHLFLAFKGKARRYSLQHGLNFEDPYHCLVSELEHKFLPLHRRVMDKHVLRNRTRKVGESIQDFADKIETLAGQAYRNRGHEFIENYGVNY